MIALALSIVATVALVEPPAGPCDIVSKATITALLGQPAPAGEPSGPEKDEDSDGMVSHCWYRAGSVMIIVSEVTYTSAAKAKQSTNAEYIKSQMGDDKANVVEEKGVGDGGFWATTDKGAHYAVLKGSRVIAVGLGGALSKPKASYHDALRDAALGGASR